MNPVLYILQSASSKRYYIGSTNDIERRLMQHNKGAVKATRNKGPWFLNHALPFPNQTYARKAEAYLKKQKSRISTEAVISGTFNWPESFGI